MACPTVEQLSAIPLLASLTREQLEAAAGLFTLHAYEKNTIVSSEGDPIDVLHLILAGHVQAFWRDQEGHQLKLGIDGPGTHFHDHALSGESVVVSHIAIDELRLASIRLADLKQLMHRHPEIALVLLTDIATRLRRLLLRTKTLTMEDVYGRVIKLLLASSEVTEGKLVTQPLTHAEIGQRIGATREMVGRVLRDLARGEYIRTEQGRIEILRKLPARW